MSFVTSFFGDIEEYSDSPRGPVGSGVLMCILVFDVGYPVRKVMTSRIPNALFDAAFSGQN